MKTLKNDNDRKLYVSNPNNWEIVREQNPFRISVLNKTPFVKLDIWTSSGWRFIGYFKANKIHHDKDIYYVSDLELDRLPVKQTEIIRFLKKNKI